MLDYTQLVSMTASSEGGSVFFIILSLVGFMLLRTPTR
jgi:hypothetical protein